MPDVKRYATRRAAVLFRTYSFASDRLECWPERDVARRHGTGAVRPATNAVKPRTMDAPRVRAQQAAARLEVRQAYVRKLRLDCVADWLTIGPLSFCQARKRATSQCYAAGRGRSNRVGPGPTRRRRAARNGYDTRASGYPGSCSAEELASGFVRSSMLIVQVRAIDWGRRRQHQPGRRGLRAGLATTRTHRPHVALRAACA